MPPYLLHRGGAGVVGGQSQIEIAVETIEHQTQIAAAAADVFHRIDRVGNGHIPGGFGKSCMIPCAPREETAWGL